MIQMFHCNDCGEVFEEDEVIVHKWQEPHPYGEGVAYEEMSEAFCPFCRSGDIEESFDDYIED